jgi:putative membrane protein
LVAVLAHGTGYAQSDSHIFLNEMARAGLTEVQFGEIAADRAQLAEVQAFAERMIADHSRAGGELKQIAAHFEIDLPTDLDPRHQELAKHLSGLDGPELDRQYMAAMVNGHEEVATKVKAYLKEHPVSRTPSSRGDSGNRAAAASSGDAAGGEQALSQWATKILPSVEEHLALAREIRDKLE